MYVMKNKRECQKGVSSTLRDYVNHYYVNLNLLINAVNNLALPNAWRLGKDSIMLTLSRRVPADIGWYTTSNVITILVSFNGCIR